MGTCKLCGKEAKLRKSHIVPEFFYKPIYDDKHRLFPRKAGKILRPEQKGQRERLLCEACENHLSRFEKYGREVIFGRAEIKCRREGKIVYLRDLDYQKLKVFLNSLLWRMSVATGPMWKDVDLGPHEEILRKQILEAVPGDELDFPVLCTAPLYEGKILPDLILQPDYVRAERGRYYRLVLGGFLYSFFVSSATSRSSWPKELKEANLKRNGEWRVLFLDIDEIEFLKKDLLKNIVGDIS